MLFEELIRTKRDSGILSADEINTFVTGLADQSVPAEQVSALAMAIYLNGMTFEEAGQLTQAMTRSGTVLTWDADQLGGPVVDKHSTGGVGDKVSFLLAPLVAACGGRVPMIAGRGLGHTGGTVDKVESIPGYRALPPTDEFRRIVADVGCAIAGATADIAPADRRLYAIRDVTATVESVPLITASILSKKMAAGLGSLVMDIKVGTGAFMASQEAAQTLAKSIIGTAAAAGLPTRALITDMNEVLGFSAGNALEIMEVIQCLRGEVQEPRLLEVTFALCAEMLVLCGLAATHDDARQSLQRALDSGEAAEVFARMVSAAGGPSDLLENPTKHLPSAPVAAAVPAPAAGTLTAVQAKQVGLALIELKAGRQTQADPLDLSTGFSAVVPLGTHVEEGDPLALVHAADAGMAAAAVKAYLAACTVSDATVDLAPVVHERIAE